VIVRRPRRGRKYQKPLPTGDILSCPFCSGEHEVLAYSVSKGKSGERKVRTWACPKVGRLSLNQGKQWDEYIESIIVRPTPKVRTSGLGSVQSLGGASDTIAQPSASCGPSDTGHGISNHHGIQTSKGTRMRSALNVSLRRRSAGSVCASARPPRVSTPCVNPADAYSMLREHLTDDSPPSLSSVLSVHSFGRRRRSRTHRPL